MLDIHDGMHSTSSCKIPQVTLARSCLKKRPARTCKSLTLARSYQSTLARMDSWVNKNVTNKYSPFQSIHPSNSDSPLGLWLYHTRINSLITHDLTVHHTRSLITQSFLHREAYGLFLVNVRFIDE
jgi:hypothetical protein